MHRFIGVTGILLILFIAFVCSNNRRKINLRLVLSGFMLQVLIAILVLKLPAVSSFLQNMGKAMLQLEGFAKAGAGFVLGDLGVVGPSGSLTTYRSGTVFVFAINLACMIIFVCALVSVMYYLKIIQFIVSFFSRIMNTLMQVSGAESLSNISSAVVGQVEAQVMIQEYLPTMTKSELLASMAGSLACISGSILIVYANMGVRPDYLIAASCMAAPGALVISKIVFPEVEESMTKGHMKLKVGNRHANLIDAIVNGISDGIKIAVQMIGMIIGFIALITMVNWCLGQVSSTLSLDYIFSLLFYPFAWAMGIPAQDINNAATLLGQKLTINEFIAFTNLVSNKVPIVTPKGQLIVTIAVAGFANFGSIAMLLGGMGKMIPGRKDILAKLAMRALLCGTLASYLSAAIAGIIM